MPAVAGRKMVIKKGNTVIGGGRSDTMTINNEAIDITSKDDGGWRVMFGEVGVRTVDISFEGVFKDTDMTQAALASDIVTAYTVDIDGVGTFSGDFALVSVELGADHDGAMQMSGSLQSSGAITYTAVV